VRATWAPATRRRARRASRPSSSRRRSAERG
jgi:hypothetical protein